mmetsp:Transcript_22464/g.51773  ORF Transcript_22464/g.51773 Transcript_22464/m.51773 type:complete len:228 (-) Transcript_22464:599-1282(-)
MGSTLLLELRGRSMSPSREWLLLIVCLPSLLRIIRLPKIRSLLLVFCLPVICRSSLIVTTRWRHGMALLLIVATRWRHWVTLLTVFATTGRGEGRALIRGRIGLGIDGGIRRRIIRWCWVLVVGHCVCATMRHCVCATVRYRVITDRVRAAMRYRVITNRMCPSVRNRVSAAAIVSTTTTTHHMRTTMRNAGAMGCSWRVGGSKRKCLDLAICGSISTRMGVKHGAT